MGVNLGSAVGIASGIAAVAFDIDGTLYPNYRYYLRMLPFIARHPRFFAAFVAARHVLHSRGAAEDDCAVSTCTNRAQLCTAQAGIMARYLNTHKTSEADVEKVLHATERFVYQGWARVFARVKPHEGAREAITAFRERGLKIGVLSDFPIDHKLDDMGLGGLFDAELCSEDTGALKPARKPFALLAEKLGVECEHILFVGNSVAYDVAGAQRAGMKTALIRDCWTDTHGAKNASAAEKADFTFTRYHELERYVTLGLRPDTSLLSDEQEKHVRKII